MSSNMEERKTPLRDLGKMHLSTRADDLDVTAIQREAVKAFDGPSLAPLAPIARKAPIPSKRISVPPTANAAAPADDAAQRTRNLVRNLFLSHEWIPSGTIENATEHQIDTLMLQKAFTLKAAVDVARQTKPPFTHSVPIWSLSALKQTHASYADHMKHICGIMSHHYATVKSEWMIMFRWLLHLTGGNELAVFKTSLVDAAKRGHEASAEELKTWKLFETNEYKSEVDQKLDVLTKTSNLLYKTKGTSLRDILHSAYDTDVFQGMYRTTVLTDAFSSLSAPPECSEKEKGPFFCSSYFPFVAELMRIIKVSGLEKRAVKSDQAWLRKVAKQLRAYNTKFGQMKQEIWHVSAGTLQTLKFPAVAQLMCALREMRLFNDVFTRAPQVQKPEEKAPAAAAAASRIRHRAKSHFKYMYERHAVDMPFWSFVPFTHPSHHPDATRRGFIRASDDEEFSRGVDEMAAIKIDMGVRRPHPDRIYTIYARLQYDFIPALQYLLQHGFQSITTEARFRRSDLTGVYRWDFMHDEAEHLIALDVKGATGHDLVGLMVALLQKTADALHMYLQHPEHDEKEWNDVVAKEPNTARLVAHFHGSRYTAHLSACIADLVRDRGAVLSSSRMTVLLREKLRSQGAVHDEQQNSKQSGAIPRDFVPVQDILESARKTLGIDDKPLGHVGNAVGVQASEMFTAMLRHATLCYNYYFKVAIHCMIAKKVDVPLHYKPDFVTVEDFQRQFERDVTYVRKLIRAAKTPELFSFETQNASYRYLSTSTIRHPPSIRVTLPILLDTCKCVQAVSPVKLSPEQTLEVVYALTEATFKNFQGNVEPYIYEVFHEVIDANAGQVSLWEHWITTLWTENGGEALDTIKRQVEAINPKNKVYAQVRLMQLFLFSTKPFLACNRLKVSEGLSDLVLRDCTERLDALAELVWQHCRALCKI